MFFIYSLNLLDLTVKLHDYCDKSENINALLETVAKNFIQREQGERRAEQPYYDGIPDDKLTQDGYFLRHSPNNPNQIDVYLRTTLIAVGRMWNTYEISCKKILHFSVAETLLPKDPVKDPAKDPAKDLVKDPAKDLVKDPAKEPVKDPAKEPAKDPEYRFIEQLQERLCKQREKVEAQLNVDAIALRPPPPSPPKTTIPPRKPKTAPSWHWFVNDDE